MKVLVNFGPEDKSRTNILAHMLNERGVSAFSTEKDLELSQLLSKASMVGAQAILLSNEATLSQCVNELNPTVDNWRGSRLDFSIPVFVINKLHHVNSTNYGKWLLEKDLDKLKFYRKKSPVFTFNKLTHVKYFQEAYADLSKAIAIYYDIETKTFKPKSELEVGETVITCASWTGIFPDGSLRTYVLPIINFDRMHWETNEELAKSLLLLRKINALPIPKAMHNGMYDATHSIRYHAEPLQYTYDTMVAAHSKFSELPKDLSFVASYELFDYIQWKGDAEAASKSRNIEAYWGYNGKDTWHGARIMIEQLRNMPDYAIHNYKTKFKLSYPSLYANFEGFHIDQEVRTAKRSTAEKELLRAEAALRVKVADPGFNPGSWQQVEKYVYRIFGAKHPRIGKSKSGTDEKNLTAVAQQHPLLARLATDIISYRGEQKAIGTYFDFLQFKGRLLWQLNPFGAETERFTCNASSLWCGTQVQNVPGYAKDMLVADEGFEIFEADEKQAEGRTTAYVSQEVRLIAALEDATRDFYLTLGTLFFQIPYEEVSEFFRNKVIKKIVHGTNYMMGAKTFIENAGIMVLYEAASKLGLTIVNVAVKGSNTHVTLKAFAASLLDAYHVPFPRIREWYKEIKHEIKTTGALVSPVGHTRIFFGDMERNHQIFMGAVAHQPQNLSGHVLNLSFMRSYQTLVIPSNGRFRLKAQIHDSILGQWPIGEANIWAPRLLECMDNPIIVHGREMRIPIDIKYGQNWGERSDKNPNGTRKWKAPQ
ncbi:DNA polymerase I [Polaromonas phage Tiera]|nr:DNA polymerase I [Polaromonas phage Tiera]